MSERAIDPRPLPPDTILNGCYLVKKCVGSGGFGVTYLAENLRARGDRVAIKEYFPRAVAARGARGAVIIRADSAREFSRWRENYEREYALLAKLRGNRALINVRETFRENDTSYLVMDFIPGETLEQRVRREGPMGGEALMGLLRPMLPELAKMHDADVLHRDINPANIMLPPGDMPKLIDFGSARPVPREGGRLTALLRPGFAPPEQYSAWGRQGPQTDVYGLCASLYFALTGVAPPDGKQRMLRDELKPLDELCHCPPRLSRAVMKGLELPQERRQPSFDALWRELFGDKAAPPRAGAGAAEGTRPGRAEPITPVKPAAPVKSVAQVAPGSPAGGSMSRRLQAARRIAGLLRPLNPEKYGAVIGLVSDMQRRQGLTAADRVALEEAVAGAGRAFAALCALLTRNDA